MAKREQHEQESYEVFYSRWGDESLSATKRFVTGHLKGSHHGRVEYTHSIRFINIRDYNDG